MLGNNLFLQYISVRKQGNILGGDISIVKVVDYQSGLKTFSQGL